MVGVSFGARFGAHGPSMNFRSGLEIEFTQPDPIQQHDLPLGLAEEGRCGGWYPKGFPRGGAGH